MARPTVQEVDYQQFRRALERAVASGTRITPSERERWAKYVADNGIRETNVRAYAAGKFEGLEAVIIDEPAPSGGYFLWSASEEVALQWRSGDAAS
jgi:hypothetical protein